MSGASYGFIHEREQVKRREALSSKMFDFADLLEAGQQGMFEDVQTLPHAKQEILGGFLNAIANARTKDEVGLYSAGALSLAHYQEGVGDKPCAGYILSADEIEELKSASPDEFMAFVRSSDHVKIKSLTDMSKDDFSFIRSCVEAAKAMNPHLRSPIKKIWEKFRERGFYSPFSDGFVDASLELLNV